MKVATVAVVAAIIALPIIAAVKARGTIPANLPLFIRFLGEKPLICVEYRLAHRCAVLDKYLPIPTEERTDGPQDRDR